MEDDKKPLVFKIHHEQRQHENQYMSVRHYNDGINHFDWQMRKYHKLGFDTKHRFYCPGLWIGRRGQFKNKFEWKYYGY